ncbi:hypothetical protein FPZ54_04480 [Sphingomonas suaedae]|uniref:Uncharacterized protein n=1 Tax=Sphingomonas suaedae TaxID=2599297 RepID=A0A518RD01_9SPHN|nr:hypothetical protein [Sphingomonas suaedae]QDX25355.1 hypothetical protein FPZ54_04480 [Sphingomonas suaedae]
MIGLATFSLIIALAFLSLKSDRDAVSREIRAGFETGALVVDADWRFADVRIGAHQTNDCLILLQAIDQRATTAQLSITPLSAPTGTESMCLALSDAAAGTFDPDLRFYHNYVHAQTSVARLLLPLLGVDGLRALYKLAVTVLLIAGLAIATIGLAERRALMRNALWLLLFALFGRWFGFESFGQSLGHGPSDLLILAFLLFLARGSRDAPMRERTALLGSGLFGALTMGFEMLTGGIPLGLALTIGCVPIALAHDARIGVATLRCAIAYLTAVAAVAVAKIAAVSIVFGTAPVVAAIRQFLFRTGVDYDHNPDAPAGAHEFFTRVWAGFESMAPGMHWLAVGMMSLALVLGGWGYAQLRRTRCKAVHFQAAAMAGSALVIPLWMVVFWQHTAQHAWFMDRILIWPMAAGFALFLMALIERERIGAPDEQPAQLA